MKLGKLFKAAVGVVTLPVDIVKDVFTIGGAITEEPKCYTAQKIDEIEEDLDDVTD